MVKSSFSMFGWFNIHHFLVTEHPMFSDPRGFNPPRFRPWGSYRQDGAKLRFSSGFEARFSKKNKVWLVVRSLSLGKWLCLGKGSQKTIENWCLVNCWYNDILVGGDWNHGILNDFPFYLGMECHHPNWRSPWFFRGVAIPPTRSISCQGFFTE